MVLFLTDIHIVLGCLEYMLETLARHESKCESDCVTREKDGSEPVEDYSDGELDAEVDIDDNGHVTPPE